MTKSRDLGNLVSDGASSGVAVYATIDAMTSVASPSAGDLAYVTDNTSLYQNNGNGWYRIAVINTTPNISSPANNADVTLAKDGTATTITITASDADEGATLAYSYTVSTGSISGIASVTNASGTALTAGTQYSSNVFKIVPATSGSGGTFTLTFNAHDQINTGQITQNFTLSFGWGNVNDLTNQSSELKTYSFSGMSGFRAAVDFYDSGTKAVVQHGTDIYICTCTTAYDISTASYATSPHTQYMSGSNANGYHRDLVWGDSTNGTAGYTLNTLESGRVRRVDNSATYGNYYWLNSNETKITGLGATNEYSAIWVKDDATTKYLFVQIARTIKRYDWTTNFSSASNASAQTVTVSGFTSQGAGLRMDDTGKKIYMMDHSFTNTDQLVRQFNLSTAWDLSTCSTTPDYSFTIPSSLNLVNTKNVGTRPDGSRLYFANGINSGSTMGQTHSFSFG